MLKTPKDYQYDEVNIDSANAANEEMIIDVNHILKFQFFTNDGQTVLDIVSGTSGNGQGGAQVLNSSNSLQYSILNDSLVKLPVIGEVNLVGMSIREAQHFLEEMYSKYYKNPFVQITITNNRVIVFPGSGGEAQVVYLKNNNTTLLEAIALSGGIAERGRAKRIKLIRKDESGERKVILIDLSTIEGLKYTDIIVQNGDYIYIEPVPELGKELLKDIAPIFSLISSTAGIIFIISKL
ncbi:MAG: polysaccharide biosynthesis/export family protein [Putridiphycobacter sp.]